MIATKSTANQIATVAATAVAYTQAYGRVAAKGLDALWGLACRTEDALRSEKAQKVYADTARTAIKTARVTAAVTVATARTLKAASEATFAAGKSARIALDGYVTQCQVAPEERAVMAAFDELLALPIAPIAEAVELGTEPAEIAEIVEAVEIDAAPAEVVAEEVAATEIDYSAMTLTALRDAARGRIKGFMRLKKAELIEALQNL